MTGNVAHTRAKGSLTEQEFVLVHNICDSKVDRSEDKDERLHDAVQKRDNKDKGGLRVNNAIVDNRRGIQFGKVYRHKINHQLRQDS